MAPTHFSHSTLKNSQPGVVQLCVHAWLCAHVCTHMCSTHICGQTGWDQGSALTRTSSGGQMELVQHCQAAFCQAADSSSLLWRGRRGQCWAGQALVPGWSGLIMEAPARCPATSDPWPRTPVPFQSWKEGSVFIVARVTHALSVLSISPEVGEECALHVLSL